MMILCQTLVRIYMHIHFKEAIVFCEKHQHTQPHRLAKQQFWPVFHTTGKSSAYLLQLRFLILVIYLSGVAALITVV